MLGQDTLKLLIVLNISMKACKIDLQNLKAGDEIIIVYDGGHMHGVIKELKDTHKISTHQFDRDISVSNDHSYVYYNVSNSDVIYLIDRSKSQS
jgi:hypothetical protein